MIYLPGIHYTTVNHSNDHTDIIDEGMKGRITMTIKLAPVCAG